MGYMRHHAIIVTCWDKNKIAEAHAKAIELFDDQVSPVSKSQVNNYKSFFIAPDGSKEGWDESNRGDTGRAKFIEWLRNSEYYDYYDWAELQYGDGEGDDRLLQSRAINNSLEMK